MKPIIIFGAITAIILLTFLVPKTSNETTTIPGSWDISSEVNLAGHDIYLIEESDFDYSSDNVQTVATTIKKGTNNPEDALRETIKFVVNNIQYSSKISVSFCYAETASSVLELQTGDCVSMSRLVTALLRAQGIPARTRGGCLSFVSRCAPVFSAVPGLEPKTVALVEGDFKKRGFLHEYVEAWTPDEGWVLIEATSGQKFDKECGAYLHYGYDTNNRNRCTITDRNFWEKCSTY